MNPVQTSDILQQSYLQIENLIKEGHFLDAHRACLELLRLDPQNLKVIRLKSKIEKLVATNNRNLIKKDLAALEPLWREKNYKEYALNLKKLEPYMNDYPPLRKIFVRAQKAYEKQIREEENFYFSNECEKILSLAEQKNFSQALLDAEKLLAFQSKERDTRNLLIKLRKLWIEEEIRSNQTLLASNKFEEIFMFYQKMKKIDPESSVIEDLIRTAQKRYERFRIDEKKEFLYDALTKTRTLFQLKKYEKSLEAAKEILSIDPFNKEVQGLLKKSQTKARHQLEEEVVQQILSSKKRLQSEYEQNHQAFQRVF
jgi:tetratricopeptide (TPR) repeat protein